jgi:hypothetical protein
MRRNKKRWGHQDSGRRFPREEDTPAIAAALEWLNDNAIAYKRPDFCHLEVGGLNFWPDRGTLTIDKRGRLNPGGFDAFKALILRQGSRQLAQSGQGPASRTRTEQARTEQGGTAQVRAEHQHREQGTTEQEPGTSDSNVIYLNM